VGSVFTVEFPMAAAAGEPSASPLQGRVIGILSPSRTWRGELERRLLRWGATVRNLSVGEDTSTLDLADVDALLLFQRHRSGGAPVALQGRGAALIRVCADGPLHPEGSGRDWSVSSYAQEPLRELLQQVTDHGTPSVLEATKSFR
jgi:hypothetical protein